MLDGQLDFHETLFVPPYSGRGRPRTLSGQIKKQVAAAAQARRAAKSKLSEAAIAEEYRVKRKRWDAERYKRCPERVKDGARRSYRKHFEKRALTAAERYRRFAQQGMLYRAEKRAAARGLDFNLTIDDVVIPSHCPVLGMTLLIREGGRAGAADNSPTLDRINNSKGYVKGNVCVISWRANRIKGDATLAEAEQLLAYMRACSP
jgi:hypothetical protein